MSRKSKCEGTSKEELFECMEYRNEKPLAVYKINDKYILAVYQGSLSKYDIVLRYRQKDEKGNWSNIRTPKHIHWAVDMLIKLSKEEKLSKEFLECLIKRWEELKGFKSEEDRKKFLDEKFLLGEVEREAEQFIELSNYGEYSIKFLILLALLLMKQEKTNREDAYMFKKLLEALKEHKEIYKIVSIATHRS